MRTPLTIAAWLACAADPDRSPSESTPPATVPDSSDTTVIPSAPDSGDTGFGGSTEPPLAWVSAYAGPEMSCGIASDGTVRCWGIQDCTVNAPDPTAKFQAISVGWETACGIRDDGTLLCWCCDNAEYGVGICNNTPAGVFTGVEVGGGNAIAQDASGTVTLWGDGWEGIEEGTEPVGPVLDFDPEEAYEAAVLPDGTLAWWGFDTQWGGAKPPDAVAFTRIELGREHACGLDAAGTAYCWGLDTTLSPWPDPPPGTWAWIEAWEDTACVVDADGWASCWWGAAPPGNQWSDMPVVQWQQIGLGESGFGCGVDVTGQAYCWGGGPGMEWLQVPDLNAP